MWELVIPIVVAIAVSVIAVIFTPVRKYFFGPTLRVVAFRYITTDEGFYWQALVMSTGILSSERAKSCRVKITVWPIREGEVFGDQTKLQPINFRNTPVIQSESICWAKPGNPETLDINPSDIEPTELAFFHVDDKKIVIPSEQGWSGRYGIREGIDLVHLRPGNYTFRVMVTAENAHPGWAHFEFREPTSKDEHGPWATFCLRRNCLFPFRIPPLTGVFDLRKAGIKRSF